MGPFSDKIVGTMKATFVRWFLIGYAVLLLAVIAIDSSSEEAGLGISINWVNGDYSFSGGAPPWTLAFSGVNIALYGLLYASEGNASSRPMPHLFRRFLAGLVDWMLAIFTVATLLGLIAVLIEYRSTGVFERVIDRQEPHPLDTLEAVVDLPLLFGGMVSYMVFPLMKGKPTPGACIFGYRVTPDEGSRMTLWFAALRALLGSVALLGWPCWIMAYALKRDKVHGKFWLDHVFRIHAEYLE